MVLLSKQQGQKKSYGTGNYHCWGWWQSECLNVFKVKGREMQEHGPTYLHPNEVLLGIACRSGVRLHGKQGWQQSHTTEENQKRSLHWIPVDGGVASSATDWPCDFFVFPGSVHHCHVPIHHAPCSAHPWCDPAWSCRRHQVLSLPWYLTVSWPTGMEPGVGSGMISCTERDGGGWWWWCNGNRFFPQSFEVQI